MVTDRCYTHHLVVLRADVPCGRHECVRRTDAAFTDAITADGHLHFPTIEVLYPTCLSLAGRAVISPGMLQSRAHVARLT